MSVNPSKIVMGYIEPMKASDMVFSGRFAARESTRPSVDLDYAKDLATRRSGPAAEAAVGRQLNNLAAQGKDVAALAKAMNEFFQLAEGVKSGKPSPAAVEVANRIVTPTAVTRMSAQEGGVDLITLAYAVLHLDECNRLNGGLS